jgi:hypothetical protein
MVYIISVERNMTITMLTNVLRNPSLTLMLWW